MIVEVGNCEGNKFSDTSTIRLNQSQVKFVFEQSRNPETTVGVAV